MYNEVRKEWIRIKDFIAGLKRIKENALCNDYIDLPSGLNNASVSDTKKQAYIKRAFVPELANVALQEANGRIFQQGVKLPNFPESLDYMNDDIDTSNVSLYEMTQKVINNLNSTSFCGILVDWLNSDVEYRTVAEKEQSGERVIWTFYEDLEILEILTSNDNKPIKITLSEKYVQRINYIGVETEVKEYEARRILLLDEEGFYTQKFYIKNENDWQMIEEITPLINGKRLTEIPFVIFNGKTNNQEIYKPRLQDMVETMNSILKNWTDLEHMIHNICMPVRYATGLTQDDKNNITGISPTALWTTINPDAKFGVLDVGGKGLDYVFSNINTKLSLAERIGYVFMAQTQKTATQTISESTGRVITLTDVVESANQGLNNAIWWSFMFAGIAYNEEEHTIKLTIKTEESAFEANNFTALINAVNQGLARMQDMHKYQVEHKITDEQDFNTWRENLNDNLILLNPGSSE